MPSKWIATLIVGLSWVTIGNSAPVGPDACFSPLEQYCARHPCPDYQESVTDLERIAAAGSCYRANKGTCGDLRFTSKHTGDSGVTYYFGSDGRVLAVMTSSGASLPGPCETGWRYYGQRLSCTDVVEREYCSGKPIAIDRRAEIRGRVIDAASDRPLEGAAIVAAWHTELPPTPLKIIFGLVVGGHGGTDMRVAQIKEALSDTDGRFVIPAWSEAEQLHRGPIWSGSPGIVVFLPGYEPGNWTEAEPETFGSMSGLRNKVLKMYRYGSKPQRETTSPLGLTPQSIEQKLTALSGFLESHVFDADDPDAPQDSPARRIVRRTQQRAMLMIGQELIRLRAQGSSNLEPKKTDRQ